MLDIPGLRDTHLVTFSVKVGGLPLPPGTGIRAIEVVRQANRIPRATVIFDDGDVSTQDFELSAGPQLVPGAVIEINAGYATTEVVIFKGVITRQRVELGPRFSHLVVEAKDAVFRMALARVSRNFSDQTEADVLSALIGLWPGLVAEVDLPGAKLPQLGQHQVSDWDFLVMRAESGGALVTVNDGTVRVAAPAVAGTAVAEAIFGQGLREASLEMDAESQLLAVGTAAWDPAGQAMLVAEETDAPVPGPGNLKGPDLAVAGGAKAALAQPGARDQAAVDARAKAEMARMRRAAIRGTVTVQGTEAVLPGLLVNLGGLGARFSGLGLVTGVRHRLGKGDWLTEVMIGGDPRSHAERFPVAATGGGGEVPTVPGLQTGLVVALEGDPSGEGRVQVRLPAISLSDGLFWARLARPDAGPSRGFCQMPEIGDEVVLGFLDADPRDPVILGSLHSSARGSALDGKDDNHLKAIVTRSGMRIHWDDEKVVARVDTPKGYALILDEEKGELSLTDEHGNSVVMSKKGIALDSPKDISLTATGDLKVEAKNISMKAKAQAGLEGGAGAELKASGTTVVKGAMVQIN
jgi:phage protein D/phage gp45-like